MHCVEMCTDNHVAPMCTDALPEGDRAAGEGQQGVAQTAHPAGTAHWQTTSHEGVFTDFQVWWASVQGTSFQGLVTQCSRG